MTHRSCTFDKCAHQQEAQHSQAWPLVPIQCDKALDRCTHLLAGVVFKTSSPAVRPEQNKKTSQDKKEARKGRKEEKGGREED